MFFQPRKLKGFTLVELLVVIAIIGLLSTLVIVSLGNTRLKARDSKRVADTKNIVNALELYYANNNAYPSSLTPGQPLVDPGGEVFLSVVPHNPSPRSDGDCPDKDYYYSYLPTLSANYALSFCLGEGSGNLSSGVNIISNEAVVNNGLIGRWKLNEGSGSVVNNFGSYSHQGTLVNSPVWTSPGPSGSGSALSFNGTNHSVNVGNVSDYDLSGPATVMGWFYIPSPWTGGAHPNLISKGASAGWDTNGWSLFAFSTNSIGVGMRNNSNSPVNRVVSFTNSIFNQWTHLAGTWDGSFIRVYQNGVQRVFATQFNSNGELIWPAPNSTNLFIGRSPGAGHFGGTISDVRIYNRALSLAEIRAIYEAGY
ncbi:MAG: prepilin-type N-terminal cleavage/methylation domain-containing protein [Patescibacteria group bacterium]|nr:MAG: prepilin-type N-terminal cleavage/methylation domain-containing protein [Patescibacteria group bacterium]